MVKRWQKYCMPTVMVVYRAGEYTFNLLVIGGCTGKLSSEGWMADTSTDR